MVRVNTIVVNPKVGKERTRKSPGNLGARNLGEAKAGWCPVNKCAVYRGTTKGRFQASRSPRLILMLELTLRQHR